MHANRDLDRFIRRLQRADIKLRRTSKNHIIIRTRRGVAVLSASTAGVRNQNNINADLRRLGITERIKL